MKKDPGHEDRGCASLWLLTTLFSAKCGTRMAVTDELPHRPKYNDTILIGFSEFPGRKYERQYFILFYGYMASDICYRTTQIMREEPAAVITWAILFD